MDKDTFLSWGLIFLSALFDSYAAFIVKTKFNELGPLPYNSLSQCASYLFHFIRSPLLLTAALAFVAAPVLWFLALNRMDLSIGYPVLVGFHLVFVLIFGLFFLRESLSMYKVIGVALLGSSLFFLFLSERPLN
ncbi:MAG: hypothetical protein HY714_05645 [Candidatus Omnitrophica bacterium]|nr:hypothetical protein [Candidatus Omnitrophota bacterium]